MRREIIATADAPLPIGAFSQAVRVGNIIFLCGQIGIDAQTGRLVGDSLDDQTHQALKNLRAILEAANSSLEQVVKVTVYLNDIADMELMDQIYGDYFALIRPARSTVQAAALPLGARLEIDCIAVSTEPR